MPWNENDYPPSLKNLDDKVRNKAIEIANALLEEDYPEGRAIAIATAQAKRWAAGNSQDDHDRDLHVVPHPQGWAVRRSNAERASGVFDTKKEARERALEMARKEAVAVVIHDEDGQIQEHVDFAGEAF